ncbi:hypothetical protein [Haematomicrobium sanguinis]|uniref:hypothetical protein n=1 Tax=Haematomicrobium sanguinis TaxID=479106 RepID=UPI000554360C|nr:hypothetical protein [Haematomicrobium sanguinis]
MQPVIDVLWVLLPSTVVGFVFYLALRAIFNADKSERRAQAKAEAEVRAKLIAEGKIDPN